MVYHFLATQHVLTISFFCTIYSFSFCAILYVCLFLAPYSIVPFTFMQPEKALACTGFFGRLLSTRRLLLLQTNCAKSRITFGKVAAAANQQIISKGNTAKKAPIHLFSIYIFGELLARVPTKPFWLRDSCLH